MNKFRFNLLLIAILGFASFAHAQRSVPIAVTIKQPYNNEIIPYRESRFLSIRFENKSSTQSLFRGDTLILFTNFSTNSYLLTLQQNLGPNQRIDMDSAFKFDIPNESFDDIQLDICMQVLGTGDIVELQGNWTNPMASETVCVTVFGEGRTPGCQNTFSSIKASECEEYVSPSGKYIWGYTGTYTDTIANSRGCDSIITIDLKIESVGVYERMANSCNQYTSPSGRYVWYTSGYYYDTLVSNMGCDSILYIDLNIENVITDVKEIEGGLQSEAEDVGYQWLNCDNNELIEGATKKIYKPTTTGNYAVILKTWICSDTSECFYVKVDGKDPSSVSDLNIGAFTAYPNPANSNLNIEFSISGNKHISIVNMYGQQIYTQTTSNSLVNINIGHFAKGIYRLVVVDESNTRYEKSVSIID